MFTWVFDFILGNNWFISWLWLPDIIFDTFCEFSPTWEILLRPKLPGRTSHSTQIWHHSVCQSACLSVCLSGVPNHTSHLISLPVCGTPQQPQQQQQTAANRSDKCTCGNLTITLPIVSAHRQLQQQTRPDKQQTTPITEQQNTILQLAFTHLRHFANKSYNRSKLPIPVS